MTSKQQKNFNANFPHKNFVFWTVEVDKKGSCKCLATKGSCNCLTSKGSCHCLATKGSCKCLAIKRAHAIA